MDHGARLSLSRALVAVAVPGSVCITSSVCGWSVRAHAGAGREVGSFRGPRRLAESACGALRVVLCGIRTELRRRLDVPDSGTRFEVPQISRGAFADAADSALGNRLRAVAAQRISPAHCRVDPERDLGKADEYPVYGRSEDSVVTLRVGALLRAGRDALEICAGGPAVCLGRGGSLRLPAADVSAD